MLRCLEVALRPRPPHRCSQHGDWEGPIPPNFWSLGTTSMLVLTDFTDQVALQLLQCAHVSLISLFKMIIKNSRWLSQLESTLGVNFTSSGVTFLYHSDLFFLKLRQALYRTEKLDSWFLSHFCRCFDESKVTFIAHFICSYDMSLLIPVCQNVVLGICRRRRFCVRVTIFWQVEVIQEDKGFNFLLVYIYH